MLTPPSFSSFAALLKTSASFKLAGITFAGTYCFSCFSCPFFLNYTPSPLSLSSVYNDSFCREFLPGVYITLQVFQFVSHLFLVFFLLGLLKYSSFIKQMQFPLLCEKSGAILLVLVGLMAGQQASRQSNKDLKFFIDHIIRIFAEFNKGTVLL